MRGLPLLLAYIEVVIAAGAAPIDVARRLAGKKTAILPEVFSRSRPPTPVQSMDDGCGDPASFQNEARHGIRHCQRRAACVLRRFDLLLVDASFGRHLLSDARLELADHGFHALSVGARRKGKRHSVFEYGFSHIEDIVDRW